MRKWILAICALVLTLAMVATPAIAAKSNASKGNSDCVKQVAGQSFVDVDEDGICDNKETNCGNTDVAICNKQPAQNNCSGNYVDADEDGVCDNRQEMQSACRGKGCGKGKAGQGRQAGKNG